MEDNGAVTRRALLSVTDKAGLVDFARGLVELGFELVSTGGTRRVLVDAGLPATEVSAVTGFPEILDGRVKTLHPNIHAGLLARLDLPAHRDALASHGIAPIELVVVNLYQFERAARSNRGFDETIEEIDIGGPAMLRAAAKNHAHVAPIVDPADYPSILEALARGPLDADTRRGLAAKVFAHTARYDAAVAGWFARQLGGDAKQMTVSGTLAERLRYGENPHQTAAVYADGERPLASLVGAQQLGGKALSFNNLLDADAALGLALDLGGTSAVYVKHNNPCGVARGGALADAIRRARAVDSVSAFGAVIALTQEVDADAAEVLAETFVEVIVAPAFSDVARVLLGAKKNLRLLAVGPLGAPEARGPELRRIRGGWLEQSPDVSADVRAELRGARVMTRRAPTPDELRALELGWIVAKHVRSNAIVFSAPDEVRAVGAGQMSRVDSVAIAKHKAGDALRGSVVASDAFFPFRDGVDLLAAAGATAIVQPGGSVRDDEVVAAADEHGLAMIFTGVRHFRH
jgi:phosphoribosylaminoimidazolecarboxamide formyltransferase/IMP cyclohydrolase